MKLRHRTRIRRVCARFGHWWGRERAVGPVGYKQCRICRDRQSTGLSSDGREALEIAKQRGWIGDDD